MLYLLFKTGLNQNIPAKLFYISMQNVYFVHAHLQTFWKIMGYWTISYLKSKTASFHIHSNPLSIILSQLKPDCVSPTWFMGLFHQMQIRRLATVN
jgi:hypothetical protein